ncbi:MAG: hypothetical protein AAF183_18055 [Pseudomonadota bacterium]
MPKYAVNVTVFTKDPVHPADVAEHVADAVATWGGQYRPEHPLFSRFVEARATCRGETSDTREDG